MRFALVTLLIAVIASRAEAGRGTGSLKYLPDDATVVIASDVARARSSAIFKRLFKIAREQSAWLDTLANAQPVEKQVDTIVLGGNSSTKQVVLVLEGRIDKLVAEAKKEQPTTETHEGVTSFVGKDGEFAVID